MLTGMKFPYIVVGNMRDVLDNILTAEPTPPSKVIAPQAAREKRNGLVPRHEGLPAVNETIEKIVLKALAKKPEGRYASAGELGRDIANYLTGQKTTAATERQFPKVPLRRMKSKRMAFAIAALIVAMATTLAVSRILDHARKLRATLANGSASPFPGAVASLTSPSTDAPASFPLLSPWKTIENPKKTCACEALLIFGDIK
jgi:hypothetical protein